MKKTENTPNGTDDISRKEAIKKMESMLHSQRWEHL